MNRVHHLKTWPGYFAAVEDGRKTFEIRFNDRNFTVGDVLVLEEFWPSQNAYSGKVLFCRVTYLTDWEQKPGFVVLALELVDSVNLESAK
jgi:hypothetical protein